MQELILFKDITFDYIKKSCGSCVDLCISLTNNARQNLLTLSDKFIITEIYIQSHMNYFQVRDIIFLLFHFTGLNQTSPIHYGWYHTLQSNILNKIDVLFIRLAACHSSSPVLHVASSPYDLSSPSLRSCTHGDPTPSTPNQVLLHSNHSADLNN